MKIAYVEWVDARGVTGRISRKDAEEEGCLVVKSAGILVREDTEVVTIALDYWSYEDRDGTIPETMRDVEVIPRVLVHRLEIIEVDSLGNLGDARVQSEPWVSYVVKTIEGLSPDPDRGAGAGET